MGQTSGDCETTFGPVWHEETVLYSGDPEALPSERTQMWELAVGESADAIGVGGLPRYAKGSTRTRFELYAYDANVPDEMELPFGNAHDDSLVQTGEVPDVVEGRIYAFQGEGHDKPIDLFARFPGYAQETRIVDAIAYDEGIASIRIPWDVASVPLDADYAANVAPWVRGGVLPLLLENLSRELSQAELSEERLNVVYYGDYTQSVDFDDSFFDDNVQHEAYVDLNSRLSAVDDQGVWARGAHAMGQSQLCLRSRYFTKGHISWTPDIDPWSGEAWAYVFGGGLLLDLFGVGSCPSRLGAVTACMTFESSEDELRIFVANADGELQTSVLDESGAIRARTVNRHAIINGWPRARVGCNNNKAGMEDTIAAIVGETLPISINTFAREALSEPLGFAFEAVFVTAEGLLAVIAYDQEDPDFPWAWAGGFANRESIPPSRVITKTTRDAYVLGLAPLP